MKFNKVLLITGYQRSGKDTAAGIIDEMLNHDFIPVNLATPIKDELGEMFDMTGSQIDELKKTIPLIRDHLITLGNAKRRIKPTYWCEKATEGLHEESLIIPDWRFYDEYDYFDRNTTHLFTCRVYAEREYRAQRGVLSNESDNSEHELDDYEDYDYLIHNNSSLDNLREQCAIVADSILNTRL